LSEKAIRNKAYDDQGNRTRLVDPDAGTITSRYNGFGELVSQSDGRGHTYTYEYDRLGRRTKRSLAGSEDSTIWVYGENGHTGLLTSIQGVEVDVHYTYDDNHRVSSITETIGDSSYTLSRGYDEFSRVNEIVYPSGKRVTRSYDADGFLESVKLEGSPVWTGGNMNAAGRWSSYTYGNGITTEKIYDPYHRLDSIHAGDALDYGFSFRKTNGNLQKRVNHSVGQAETFGYDHLSRLIKDTTGTIKYENNGNIAFKAGVGTYTYNTSRPHATGGITQVDPGYSPQAHELTFTPFNKIKDIEAYNEPLGHTYRQDFTYGPERSRKLVETYRDGVHIRSKIYAGGIYEQVTDHESDSTTGYHYISGGDGLAAILVSRPGGDSLYYVHKDHLGSILALTNHQGSVVERYSFDAWGRRRNPTDWSQKASGLGYITNRGFTGHEHMDLFGLINMNGRIYDPGLGRFLSPDPYVQMPQNAQNFNRYSYALNNPLVYTDPSGYKIQGSRQYNGAASYFWTQEVLGNMSNPFNTTSAYSYDYATNTYRNAAGRRVPYNEVKHNYVLPNASAAYYFSDVSYSNINNSVVGYAKTFSSITDKALEMNFLMKNDIVYHVRAQNGRYIVVSYYPMVSSPNVGVASSGGVGEGLLYPVSTDYRITSGYTENNRTIAELNQSRPHRAIDIATPVGTSIVSPYSGTVTTAQEFSYGKAIIIQHDYSFNGQSLSTSYSHLSQMSVNAGNPVRRGQIIGYTGTYGTGPHLHFVVRLDGQKVNPIIVFPLYHP